MLADPILVAVRVAESLAAVGVPYLVGGSLASSQYEIPRSTQDVDLVADLQPSHVPALLAALGEDFYIDAEMVQEAILHRSSFNAIYLPCAPDLSNYLALLGHHAYRSIRNRSATTWQGEQETASGRQPLSTPERVAGKQVDHQTMTVKLAGSGVALAALWLLFVWSSNTLPRILDLRSAHDSAAVQRGRQAAYTIGYKARERAAHARGYADGYAKGSMGGRRAGASSAYTEGYLDGLDDRQTPPPSQSDRREGLGPFVPIERLHAAMHRRGVVDEDE
jgi:hypothetical protein